MRDEEYRAGKHKRKGSAINPGIKLMVLTGFVFTILSLLILLRDVEWKHRNISLFVLSGKESEVLTSQYKELNTSEREIISMISSSSIVASEGPQSDRDQKEIYSSVLERQLNKNNINLGIDQVKAVRSLLTQLNDVIDGNEDDLLKKRSMISRGVILSVSEQIYEICGLKLIYDFDGNMRLIQDENGTILYEMAKKVKNKSGWNILLFVILICIILLFINYSISKKQLKKKGRMYHGYKEKEYA